MPSATIEHERKWGGGRIFCYENRMSVGGYSRFLIGRFSRWGGGGGVGTGREDFTSTVKSKPLSAVDRLLTWSPMPDRFQANCQTKRGNMAL